MQLVLDDQVRRGQRRGHWPAPTRFGGAVETVFVEPVGVAEERARPRFPRQRRKLVDCGDQEAGQAAVQRLVDGDDGQGAVAGEVALPVGAHHPQVAGFVRVRFERERIGLELRAAPGAVFKGDGGRLVLRLLLVAVRLRASRSAVGVALAAEHVGRRRLPDPETDLERPLAVAFGRPVPLQLERADQPRRPGQLVQGQQAQRVAHDDRDPRARSAARFRVAQPPQDDGEGRQTQVGLRLAAASGKEEEIHDLPVAVVGIRQWGEVQQDEGELEGAPPGAFVLEAAGISAPEGPCYGPVGDPERVQGLFVSTESRDAPFHPGGGELGAAQKLLGCLPVVHVEGRRFGATLSDPLAVGGEERLECPLGLAAGGQLAEPVHGQVDAFRFERLRLLDFRLRDPGGADQAATAVVVRVPLSRDVVAGGVPGRAGVVQGGDLFIPIVAQGRAGIGTWQERAVAPHFDLGLERVGGFGFVERGRRLPVVDQEDGDRAGARRDRRDPRDEPPLHVELQAARGGDIVKRRSFAGHEFDRDDLLSRRPLPAATALARIVDCVSDLVVSPAHGDPKRRVRSQEAQPDRRRKERLLRCLSVLGGFLGEAGSLWDLVEVVVVLVGARV